MFEGVGVYCSIVWKDFSTKGSSSEGFDLRQPPDAGRQGGIGVGLPPRWSLPPGLQLRTLLALEACTEDGPRLAFLSRGHHEHHTT